MVTNTLSLLLYMFLQLTYNVVINNNLKKNTNIHLLFFIMSIKPQNVTVACGAHHTVALLANNTIRCWGNNNWNQCDPVHLTFTDVIQVVCGSKHSVVLLSNGTIRCWGDNSRNQCDPVHCTFTNVMMPTCSAMLW